MEEKINRLKKHIEALENAYKNIVFFLNQELDKDDDGNVKMNDDKIKTYADGISKAASTADTLLTDIEAKKTQLLDLEKEISGAEVAKEEAPKEKVKELVAEKKSNPLNGNLK